MESRGAKQWAIMAMKDGWKKPRFVFTGAGEDIDRGHIFKTRQKANWQARSMNDMKVHFFPDDQSVDYTDGIEVKWIVVPVWVETMPTV